MSLKETLQKSIISAMKAGEKNRLKVLRMTSAAVKQKEIDERITLDETQVLAVFEKMLKQRRDSFKQYSEANRQDLADVEAFEIEIIQEFMPQPLSEDEIITLINDIMTSMDSPGMKDMGKIMNLLKPKVQGKADMGQISQLIKAKLA